MVPGTAEPYRLCRALSCSDSSFASAWRLLCIPQWAEVCDQSTFRSSSSSGSISSMAQSQSLHGLSLSSFMPPLYFP